MTPNRTPKPNDAVDAETRLQWAILHRAGYRPQPDLGQLVDGLLDPRVEIWSYAQRVLFRVQPMASLVERWVDSGPWKPEGAAALPDWIRRCCRGWGRRGDFTDVCADRLIAAADPKRALLIERLTAFGGAAAAIAARLRDRGRLELARRFERRTAAVWEEQIPRQLAVMPTMACQLHCRYCYSAGVATNAANTMSFEDLERVLDWAVDRGVTRICMAGGEPTLYPDFSRFVDALASRRLEYFLATNGLFDRPIADKLCTLAPLSASLHINPEIFGDPARRERFIANGRRLVQNGILTALRFNIDAASDEPLNYLSLCREIGAGTIRLAVPVPNFTRSNRFVHHNGGAFERRAAWIDRYVARARRQGLDVHLAKPFPLCLLGEKTAAVFLENGSMNACCQVHMQQFTHNMAVFPDFTFTPCLSLNQGSKREILHFDTLPQAADSYRRTVERLSARPLYDRCRVCPLARGGRCLGACLSYRLDGDEC